MIKKPGDHWADWTPETPEANQAPATLLKQGYAQLLDAMGLPPGTQPPSPTAAELLRQVERLEGELAAATTLAYETRPGLEIPPLTWADAYQNACKSLYETQDKLKTAESQLATAKAETARPATDVWLTRGDQVTPDSMYIVCSIAVRTPEDQRTANSTYLYNPQILTGWQFARLMPGCYAAIPMPDWNGFPSPATMPASWPIVQAQTQPKEQTDES